MSRINTGVMRAMSENNKVDENRGTMSSMSGDNRAKVNHGVMSAMSGDNKAGENHGVMSSMSGDASGEMNHTGGRISTMSGDIEFDGILENSVWLKAGVFGIIELNTPYLLVRGIKVQQKTI